MSKFVIINEWPQFDSLFFKNVRFYFYEWDKISSQTSLHTLHFIVDLVVMWTLKVFKSIQLTNIYIRFIKNKKTILYNLLIQAYLWYL